jgi:hypothetical protein
MFRFSVRLDGRWACFQSCDRFSLITCVSSLRTYMYVKSRGIVN